MFLPKHKLSLAIVEVTIQPEDKRDPVMQTQKILESQIVKDLPPNSPPPVPPTPPAPVPALRIRIHSKPEPSSSYDHELIIPKVDWDKLVLDAEKERQDELKKKKEEEDKAKKEKELAEGKHPESVGVKPTPPPAPHTPPTPQTPPIHEKK